MNTLVIDAHYLAHRAFHTTGGLQWNSRATGVLFGFFQTILTLKDQFQTDQIAFCFEHPVSLRKQIFPEYKFNRKKQKEISEEDAKQKREFRNQVFLLQEEYLPQIGFKNIFAFEGMESDDIMARIAQDFARNRPQEDLILVTSDSDLYQCLRSNVLIYSPQKRKLLTEGWFRKEYKISPRKWAMVKAIAGCKTDCVPGVKGIGPASTLKFVSGAFLSENPVRRRILDQNACKTILRNRRLVELPLQECPIPKWTEDNVTEESWRKVMVNLGMKSLAMRPPILTKRRILK